MVVEIAAAVCALALVLALALWSVRIVQTGQSVLVERLGRYTRTLGAGAHFLVPLLECARRYSWRCTVTRDGRAVALVCSSDAVDMRETQLDLPPFRVFTADRLEAQVDCILYFRVVDAHAAVYNVVDLYGAISSIVETTLRSTVCKLRLDEAIAGIESIQRDIGGALAAKETAWGIKLTNFDLQSILPTPEIIAATQRSVVAARTLEEQLRSAEAQALVAARQAEAQVAKERAAAECSVIVQRASAECTRVADEAAASGTRLRGDAEAHALRVAGEARVALWADALKAGFKADAVAQFEMAANWRALAARTTTTLVVPYESATYLGAQPLLRVHDS